MQMKMENPSSELLTLSDFNARIDAVSEDFHSGEFQYSAIDPFALVKLLGIFL